MPFIYEGLWPYTQNIETKRYRWHFEDPKKEHTVIDEFVIEYGSEKLLVVKVEAPKGIQHLILGMYEEENARYIKLARRPPKEQKKIKEFVAATLKLDKVKDYIDL